MNARYRVSVAALAQGDTKSAAAHFGMLLHGVQDFYAHSAWVPHPVGTPCAPGQPGTRAVSVQLSAVTDSGADHYAVALYTTDFRRSARVQLASGALPSRPLALCVAEADTVVLVVWGWAGGKEFEPEDAMTGAVVQRLPREGRVDARGRGGC